MASSRRVQRTSHTIGLFNIQHTTYTSYRRDWCLPSRGSADLKDLGQLGCGRRCRRYTTFGFGFGLGDEAVRCSQTPSLRRASLTRVRGCWNWPAATRKSTGRNPSIPLSNAVCTWFIGPFYSLTACVIEDLEHLGQSRDRGRRALHRWYVLSVRFRSGR